MDDEYGYCKPCSYEREKEKPPRMFTGAWFKGILSAIWVPGYSAREHMIAQYQALQTHIGWATMLVATGVWTLAKAIAFFKGLALAVKNAVVFIYLLVAAVFKHAVELIP